jgi:hypothetical protein
MRQSHQQSLGVVVLGLQSLRLRQCITSSAVDRHHQRCSQKHQRSRSNQLRLQTLRCILGSSQRLITSSLPVHRVK